MKSILLPLFLCVIGVLVGVPALLWIAGSGTRLKNDDVWSVAQPVARIHLADIGANPLSVTFVIPATTHWMRVRRAWGEPEIVLVAIGPTRSLALCLTGMPLRIELRSSTGRVIALRPSYPPYGYSDECVSSCLRFRAGVGEELTFTMATTGAGMSSAVSGDLVVVGAWYNEKDKLVGLALEEDLDSDVKWLLLAGGLFVLPGVALFVRRSAVQRLHPGTATGV